jgi:hypothetical protein
MFGFNADMEISREFEDFYFGTYENNRYFGYEYARIGYGVAYIPPELANIISGYGRHKFSVALVWDNLRNIIYPSFRYKIQLNRYGFNCQNIYSIFLDNYSNDFFIKYKLTNNIGLKYTYLFNQVASKQERINTFGWELTFE